ncbi:MAG: hypothetical protein IKN74_04015 [Clostridia bacterium]|nr:hypothetical protein [Clostridia bacterium]
MKKFLKALIIFLLLLIVIIDFYNTITVIFDKDNLLFNLIGVNVKDIYFKTTCFETLIASIVILLITFILYIIKNSFAAVIGFINVIIRFVFLIMCMIKANYTNINNLILLGINILVLIFYIIFFSICKKMNIKTMREKMDRLKEKV